MDEMIQSIMAACVPVIILLIAIITGYVIKLINRVCDQSADKANNELLQYAILAVNSIAVTVVKSFNQQVVNDLKEKSEDGKLTIDEIRMIKTDAINTIKESLTDNVKEAIENAYGDLDQYISNAIESAICDIKSES